MQTLSHIVKRTGSTDVGSVVKRRPELVTAARCRDHDITESTVADEAAESRRLERDAAIVVSAIAALTSFQYRSSEQLQ